MPVIPFNFCLDPVETAIDAFCSHNYGRHDLSNFLIIGGNGGGEFVAIDLREGRPRAVVTIDMITGSDSAEIIAPTFDELVGLIGIEATDNSNSS